MDARVEIYRELDIHIRRHLRKLIWIAWKKPKTRETALIRRGLDSERAWKSSVNGRGAWWNAGALHMSHAYKNNCFRRLGLYSLELQYCPELLLQFRNRRMPNGMSESLLHW